MWWIPDGAPPLAAYGALGTGLKTRSFGAALARVEGLLAHATDVVLERVELSVHEPASQRLVESFSGRLPESAAGEHGGGWALENPGALFAKHPHTHDALAGEAWQRFGTPTHVGVHVMRGGPYFIDWRWLVEDPALAPQALAAWAPYVAANDKGMLDQQWALVRVHATWTMRLLDRRGSAVAHPYPRSRVFADLRGTRSTASLGLVLPHESATKAFHADCAAMNAALGITLSAKGWKLNAPRKKGGGRAVKKLPGL